ncbi:hypothetical protein CRG98_049082, partial [Punica granatum]
EGEHREGDGLVVVVQEVVVRDELRPLLGLVVGRIHDLNGSSNFEPQSIFWRKLNAVSR